MDVPDARYARSGGVAIAYQVVGEGPRDLVYSPHLADIYSLWLTPHIRAFLDRLAGEVRLIVFNPRGTGLSDRPRNLTLESRMDDFTAVMDEVASERATLFGVGLSASACALFGATYPDRCERLVLVNPYPRLTRSESYPYGLTEEEGLANIRQTREGWGDRAFLREELLLHEPWLAEDEEALDRYVWQSRLAVSPTGAAEFQRMGMETDITDVLGSIRVPTLILAGAARRDVAEYVSERVRGSKIAERPARGVYTDEFADVLLQFLRGDAQPTVPSSVLATVLFTDLVGSTERAAELGDRAWGELLAEHHRRVRQELVRYRGVEVDTAGDGFFCRFDGSARAIACAQAIVEGARALDLEVRAGVHTGECELIGEKIAGLAVNVGSRIASTAAPGEVLVSQTVKDLVAGSGLEFEERGEHELKGVPGVWRLYAVADA
jgi:class 3 adenylate cyclase